MRNPIAMLFLVLVALAGVILIYASTKPGTFHV